MFEENQSLPPRDTPLDRLSVDELEHRILQLKAEIQACQAELEKKRAHKSASDALFGGGD